MDSISRRDALRLGYGALATAVAGWAVPKVMAWAADPTGGVYAHHRYKLTFSGTDYPAYCLESIAVGPNIVKYSRITDRAGIGENFMRGLDYIMYYGYCKDQTSDKHYGSGLSGWDFMDATQLAVWKYVENNSNSGKFSGKYYRHIDDTGAYADWRSFYNHSSAKVRNLADKMVNEAKANRGKAYEVWVGFAWPYKASDGGQALLTYGYRQYKGYVTAEKDLDF